MKWLFQVFILYALTLFGIGGWCVGSLLGIVFLWCSFSSSCGSGTTKSSTTSKSYWIGSTCRCSWTLSSSACGKVKAIPSWSNWGSGRCGTCRYSGISRGRSSLLLSDWSVSLGLDLIWATTSSVRSWSPSWSSWCRWFIAFRCLLLVSSGGSLRLSNYC